jgi:D-proline reductase (dithiol) PrdB
MVYLAEMPADARNALVNQELPGFVETPWANAPDIRRSRVAIVSTAGLHRANDTPFRGGAGDYRIIPDSVDPRELRMSHISTNFDRLGFQQDLNVVFPIERLRELVAEGAVGGAASYHYSFMGATPPSAMEASARELAGVLKGDRVDAVLLIGV